ncbi:MAG: DUF5069 domain-containing protein [Candidatus Latescibacteria bacterium]|jgi:hypothetical protein|nr:DUF5069 domain-containing protein [Candidatus Latescibacterota bacterium]MBT4137038.1 DUF5069 domain-containing protein [Candidatus Latescibacterota bacterium]MBT5830313.1 DUF5069 domain-containing protein [Candidatus Latescibacterota bacterium]
MAYPRSPRDQERDMYYFPRMTDKIRLHLKGELDEDYLEQFGNGFDGRCCAFLKVDHADVIAQVKAGKSDTEVLTWCFESGHSATEDDILMFNAFMSKRGWRDDTSDYIAEIKARNNISDRDDIQTFFDLIEADEERI